MIKVMQSKDYGMFRLSSFNRDVRKTKALEDSFRRHGWIDAYPMHVQQNGGRQYIIKAGHHRFEVARKLGIPVKFIVSNDTATIHELERSTTNWNLNDYLVSYCRQGKADYTIIKDYCDETGIALTNAMSMFYGQQASSNNVATRFKDGVFTILNTDHANTVKDIVLYLKKYGVGFAATNYWELITFYTDNFRSRRPRNMKNLFMVPTSCTNTPQKTNITKPSPYLKIKAQEYTGGHNDLSSLSIIPRYLKQGI